MTGPSTNAYLRTKVLTAGPAELRLMLFDGAIKFAEQGREALERSDHEAAFNGLRRCQDIVMELISSLRPEHEPELCERISSLYTYIYNRLVAANTQRQIEPVEEALRLLRYERETWVMVLQRLAAENVSARQVDALPEEPPVNAPPAGPRPAGPSGLIGAKVSVKG